MNGRRSGLIIIPRMQIGQRSAGHCVTGRRSTDREAEVKEAGTVEEEEAEEGLKVVNSKYISGNR